MNTTIKTSSEKQFKQIRRFIKKNKIYNTITKENGLYSVTLFGLKLSEIEKYLKDFIKTNHLIKVQRVTKKVILFFDVGCRSFC